MAKNEILITIRLRWWVVPYMWLLRAFIVSIDWALDDDEMLDEFIEHQVDFIGDYGFRFDET